MKKITVVCTLALAFVLLLLWTVLLPKTVKYTVKQEKPVSEEVTKEKMDSFTEKEEYTVKLSDGKIIAESKGKTVREINININNLTSEDVEMLTRGIAVENDLQLQTLAEYLQS